MTKNRLMENVMKGKFFIIILAAVIMATACSAGFDLSTWELKGQTLTFMDSDGYGYTSLTFNDDATGGTYEEVEFIYGFASAAAAASGNYTDKSWYQNDGMRGTFTYDEENHEIIITKTYSYARKSGVSTSYSTDYEWRTPLSVEQDSSSTVTAYSYLLTRDFYPNSDSTGFEDWLFNDGENTWSHNYSYVETVTDSGIATVTSYIYTRSYTIAETELSASQTTINSEKVGSASPVLSTHIYNYDYTVSNFFLNGEETGDKSFKNVWKKGNNVTFILQRTNFENLLYEGSTAPSTPPTVDPVSASGSSSGGTSGVDAWDWSINNANSDDGWAFTHFGNCIITSEELVSSYRGIER